MFKKSAEAGKKEATINPHDSHIVICAIRMRDGKQLMNEIIEEKDFNAATVHNNIKIAAEPKEPSKVIAKTKELSTDIADGTAITAKAIVVGTGNLGRSIGSLFTAIGDKMKENAETYDAHKLDKAAKLIADKAANKA